MIFGMAIVLLKCIGNVYVFISLLFRRYFTRELIWHSQYSMGHFFAICYLSFNKRTVLFHIIMMTSPHALV